MADEEQGRPPGTEQPTRSERGNVAESPGDTSVPLKRLGDFELLREIGRGGMGIVYEAQQISLKRRVALKVLPPGLGLTTQAVKRFEREAQAAAKLHHTNIVPVYATGEDQGCHYYAMELVEGQSLSRVLDDLCGKRSNPLLEATVTQVVAGSPDTWPEKPAELPDSTSLSDTDTGGRQWFDTVAKLMADVGDALQYAHDRGVIHRDVKPANLLLSGDGRLCLGDFGLARVAQEPGMTVSGSFLGTPAYMSPEQIAAGRIQIDHRTDVYSLGAVLYEMLTLQRPFSGDSRDQVLSAIMAKDPKPPRRINPRVPVDLETICLKAMEKDPDRRYPTAGEMAADLKRYVQRGLITARRAGPLRRAAKAARRHPVLVTVAIAAVLLVATAGSLTWVFSVRQSGEMVRRALADARLSLGEGEYRQALRSVEEALAADPELAEGRMIRARALMNLGRVGEAVDAARARLGQDPDDWKAHAILAAAATLEFGETVVTIDAERHVRAVESGAPETAEAYNLRALVTDSSPEALDLLDRALEIDPGNVEALVQRINRYRRVTNFAAALADCERLVAMRPRSARARRLTARVHLEQFDAESAMAEVERAIEIDPGDALNYSTRSRIYSEVGRLDAALADMTRAIEIDPDRAVFYFGRAGLHQLRREPALAAADAERAIELEPENPAGRWTLIYERFELGGLEAAMEQVNHLLEMSEAWPDEGEQALTRFYLVEWLLDAGEPERARREAEKAVELAPDEWTSHMAVAFVRARTEDPAAAAESCERAAAIELDEPSDHLLRAYWFRRFSCPQGKELALADFSKAIELAPWWAEAWLERAAVHREDGRFVAALADLDKAIELAPRRGKTYVARARTYLAMEERYEDALTDCDRAIEFGTYPGYRGTIDNLLFVKARALQRLDRADEALEVMERAVEERPESFDAHRNLAEVFFWLGRIDEALGSADRCVELQPNISWVWRVRAEYLTFKSGSCDRVRANLEKFWELGSHQPFGWNSLAWFHAVHLVQACPDVYDPARALELARKAVSYWPEDGSVKDTLGIVLYRNGMYEEARTALLEVLELGHEANPHPLFSLAMTCWKLGREREARQYYDRAVAAMDRTIPTNPEYLRRRDEAAELLGIQP
jgi:serine/threonine protein kinase/Tfp pilus assembly protein PilF